MAVARVERRLAAILAADVVGYSRLMEANEAGTFARLKELRRELIEPILQQYGGRFVDLKGDGAIVEFQSVVAAVEAAVEIQRAILACDPELPEDRRIRYRIGINLGDVIVDGETIYGDGINVAARIESLCEPGGVWLSRSVYNQVKGKLDLGFAATGLHQVKNISEAVETFRVALDGVVPVAPAPARSSRRLRWGLSAAAALLALILLGGVLYFWPVEPAVAKPSIAVLPFDNLGGDEATRRLAGGITEDIITDLARFRDVDVIARNSTEAYLGKAVDVREVGRALDVRYVLEGSVQRQGEKLRVTAQLIDAGTGAHLWSDSWNRMADDIFAVQTEIAQQVVNRLGRFGAISDMDRSQLMRKRPENLDAYETVLLARDSLRRFTPEGAQEALQLLRQAVTKDPQLARAWTYMAYANLQNSRWADDRRTFHEAAVDAGRRAIRLDPADAYAHAALGEALGNIGDLAQAEVEYGKALELNPNSADLLTYYSGWAMSFGKPEAGAEAADRAIRLNPNYPRWASGAYFGYAYFAVGRYSDVLQVLARLPAESLSAFDHVLQAGSLAMSGRVEVAKTAVDQALALDPDVSIEWQISDPGFTEAERDRLIEAMRKAGFPACARPEALAQFDNPVRLPECLTQ